MTGPDPDASLPWTRLPWRRCKAVAGPGSSAVRCELVRGHEGAHAADRRLLLRWIEVVR